MDGWRMNVVQATARVVSDGARWGTGVLIERDAILTCRHVVTVDGQPDGPLCRKLAVQLPGHRAIEASPQREDWPGVDALVLVLPEQVDVDPLRLSGSALTPEAVALFGYPSVDTTGA